MGIFHLSTFCRVQIWVLLEVLEGMVSREESPSLALFLSKLLVSSAPWRAVSEAVMSEDGYVLRSWWDLSTAKMAQGLVGTEA